MGINNVEYSTLTVTNTAQTLNTACSPVMPGQAMGARITVEDGAIRYRDDGTAPTSTEGHRLDIGDRWEYDSWSAQGLNWRQVLKAIQVIRVGTNSGKLKISWYD